MRAFYGSLIRRRERLVQRSAAQRRQVASALGGLRDAATTPLLAGVGVAATLLASSPNLRWWVVRAWAAYAFVQRLLR